MILSYCQSTVGDGKGMKATLVTAGNEELKKPAPGIPSVTGDTHQVKKEV